MQTTGVIGPFAPCITQFACDVLFSCQTFLIYGVNPLGQLAYSSPIHCFHLDVGGDVIVVLKCATKQTCPFSVLDTWSQQLHCMLGIITSQRGVAMFQTRNKTKRPINCVLSRFSEIDEDKAKLSDEGYTCQSLEETVYREATTNWHQAHHASPMCMYARVCVETLAAGITRRLAASSYFG